MKEQEIKKKILQEIMDMMDKKEGDSLKNHPKIAKVDIKSNDPEMAEELKDKLVEPDMENDSNEEVDEETKQKLIDLYKNLK